MNPTQAYHLLTVTDQKIGVPLLNAPETPGQPTP